MAQAKASGPVLPTTPVLPAVTNTIIYRVGTGGLPIGTFYNGATPIRYGECTIDRLYGDLNSYISSSNASLGQVVVTISKSDKWYAVSYCGPWYPVATAGPAQTSAGGDGDFLVRSQLVPGEYESSGILGQSGPYCYAARLGSGDEWDIRQDFEGTAGHRIKVHIPSRDYVFRSENCGSWTKIG